MPMNPIKVRMLPLLDSTIGTFFAQNWSLFAPNPVSQDFMLLVQPLQDSTRSRLKDNQWFNLSSPYWDRFHSNRFSAYDRLARSQSSALRSAMTGDPSLASLLEACNNKDTLACSSYRKLFAAIRIVQKEKLIRISSAFCNDLPILRNHAYVAIRIRVISFPPWSKRNGEENEETKDYDIGIHRINKSVATNSLFN